MIDGLLNEISVFKNEDENLSLSTFKPLSMLSYIWYNMGISMIFIYASYIIKFIWVFNGISYQNKLSIWAMSTRDRSEQLYFS